MSEIKVAQTGTQVVGSLYVGNTHVAIQAAIDYAVSQGGGKIFVEAGTYTINSALTNCGLYLDSNIEIYGEGIGTILKPAFTNSSNNAVISIVGTVGAEKENIYIHDLLIGSDDINSSNVGRIGIYVSYCGKTQTTGLTTGTYSRYDPNTIGLNELNKIGVKIENCVVQNNLSTGIYLDPAYNCIISNNVVQNTTGTGIYLSTSSCNNIVTNNTSQNNGDKGIHLAYSCNNVIANNVLQNNGTYGIFTRLTSNNNSILSNIIQNNASHGMYINSSNNAISNNIIQNNLSYGICLEGHSNTFSANIISNNNEEGIRSVNTACYYNSITGNTVQNNTGNGIYTQYMSYNTVVGNTVNANAVYGIYMPGSVSNAVVGNVSRGNQYDGFNIPAGSTNHTINGNNFSALTDGSTGSDITENVVRA